MTRVRKACSNSLRTDIVAALLILAGKVTDVSDGLGEDQEQPLTSESDSSDQDISVDSSSANPSTPLEQHLTEVRETLTCLFRLLPTLKDPAPHDIRTNASNPGGDVFDHSHVRSKFPQANPELLSRLGSANWKRRQHLMFLRARDEEESMAENNGTKGTVSHPTYEDGDDLSATDIWCYSHGEDVTQGSQMAGGWTSSSGFASDMGTALTSLSNDPAPKSQALERPIFGVEAQRLKLPRPPEPNSSLDGQQFRCPYCLHSLVAIASFSAWK